MNGGIDCFVAGVGSGRTLQGIGDGFIIAVLDVKLVDEVIEVTFVALTMPNSQIINCGGGERIGLSSVDENLLNRPGTWLLWPDGTMVEPDLSVTAPPDRIVILDATHGVRHAFCINVCRFCMHCRVCICLLPAIENGCGNSIVPTECLQSKQWRQP
jgi:hypothetical protein